MRVTQEEGARPIRLWTADVEPEAMQQLRNVARLPFIHPHGVAGMPDVHYGIGATVGSVVATQGAIIPAAVGVDIGCGMNALRTSLTASDLPDSLLDIRRQIERDIPLGAGGAAESRRWPDESLPARLGEIERKHPGVAKHHAERQLGSLGSGNHFIEVCLDESQDVWIMLHSGSRGVGNLFGRYFIERAKKRMEQYFVTLPDADLWPLEIPDDPLERLATFDTDRPAAFRNRLDGLVLSQVRQAKGLGSFLGGRIKLYPRSRRRRIRRRRGSSMRSTSFTTPPDRDRNWLGR